jgi:type II restriction enzyme
MNFIDLRKKIKKESQKGDFEASSNLIQDDIFGLKKYELIPLITEIGAIPEDIGHDSSEEKLFSKVSDIVLAKCFQELGLKSTVNKERSNCADVVAKSNFYKYTLVGDAKSFRLSRTAKNQKDFKVKSMADWKGDNDYSVLVCPYYQYPKSRSQIYI